MTPTVTVSDQPDAAAAQKLVRSLIPYNEEAGGPPNARPLVIRLCDPETNDAAGGLYGATSISSRSKSSTSPKISADPVLDADNRPGHRT